MKGKWTLTGPHGSKVVLSDREVKHMVGMAKFERHGTKKQGTVHHMKHTMGVPKLGKKLFNY